MIVIESVAAQSCGCHVEGTGNRDGSKAQIVFCKSHADLEKMKALLRRAADVIDCCNGEGRGVVRDIEELLGER